MAYLAALAGLLALGGHAIAPWRSASERSAERGGGRPVWALTALPLLLAAAAAMVAWLAERPEAMNAAADLDAGLGSWSQVALQAALLLAASLAVGDLLLLIAGSRLERAGWRLVGSLGVALWIVGPLALELLRVRLGPLGSEPAAPVAALLIAAACRGALALGAGEAIAPGRPRLAVLAAAALPGYWLSLPGALREMMIADGLLLTTAASAVLFAAARWLPRRLRRPALLAAVLLASLLLARAAELTALLPLEPSGGNL